MSKVEKAQFAFCITALIFFFYFLISTAPSASSVLNII